MKQGESRATFFNIYLEEIVKKFFERKGSWERRIKYIRFAHNTVLLTENETSVIKMLTQLQKNC